MKLFAVLFVVVAVGADRLENTYLPPLRATTSGGNGNFLSAPFNQPQHSSQTNNYQSSSVNGIQNQSPYGNAITLRFDNENNGDGTYRINYETDNKIRLQETGQLKQGGSEGPSSVVKGSYSYEGPDGVTYTVNYIADENGYRATGQHIPTPPPVPETIQKSLQQISSSNSYQESNNYNNNNQYNSNQQYQAPSREYLAPNKQQNSGYKY